MARILVAEDEHAVAQFVARALENIGHTVTVAGDGGEAVAKLQSDDFDLLLTDIAMPVMDGIALALSAAQSHPDMPILLMTGYAREKERAHNIDSLIVEVITKPFSLADIQKIVTRTLGDD